MQVFKVEILIITNDIDDKEELINVIENTRYPNHCMSPDVKKVEQREVDWTDEHKLNHRDTCDAEYVRLFST
jgi:hypothetical protein